MTRKERQAMGAAICAARAEEARQSSLEYRLLEDYARRACPLKPGDVVLVKEMGKRLYFEVKRIDGVLAHVPKALPQWVARCQRVTLSGEMRYGQRALREGAFAADMLVRRAG